MRSLYQTRRDVLITGLKDAGLKPIIPKATFYVWVPVPKGYTSQGFAAHLLTKAGVVVTPGIGFGEAGEGYIRMTLTKDKNELKKAAERIKKAGY